MGVYIQMLDTRLNKTEKLLVLGAKEIDWPTQFDPPDDSYLVSVVRNPMWEAALVCYNEAELEMVNHSRASGDNRPVQWLLVPKTLAERLQPGIAEQIRRKM